MSTSDQPAGSQGRTAAVVLLTVVFLAVIGASVGYVLGANAKTQAAANTTSTTGGNGTGNGNATSGSPTGAPTNGGTGNGGTGNGGTGNGGTGNGGTATPTPGTSADTGLERCLDHTEQLARGRGSTGGLTVVLYIKTFGSEVWVCRDSGDKLWYQGHVRSANERATGKRDELVEGDNALFLWTVDHEGDGYVATNTGGGGTTKYHVSREELVIEHGDGTRQRQPVLESRPRA